MVVPLLTKQCVRTSPCNLPRLSLGLDAIIQLDSLSADYPRASLRLGLSAVIETIDGFSYWALRHPIDKPDFHNADGFALPLEITSN